jgi:hypothetical protein
VVFGDDVIAVGAAVVGVVSTLVGGDVELGAVDVGLVAAVVVVDAPAVESVESLPLGTSCVEYTWYTC